MKIKNILKFIRANYLLSFFLALIVFVLFTGFIKITASKPTYIYVKVKMGQGLWWASTAKPAFWFVQALKKGETEKSLLGKPSAEILEIQYYPALGRTESQYDVYITLKLRVEANKKNDSYSFKRSLLTVGSPIEFEFPSVQVSGTIIALSKTPFKDTYVEKIIYLVNKDGYKEEFPYKYDSIQIGDTYFDGKETVFSVLEKKLDKHVATVHNILTGQTYERPIQTEQDIVVKAKVLVKKIGDNLIFGEEYNLMINSFIPFTTQRLIFTDFLIRKIE